MATTTTTTTIDPDIKRQLMPILQDAGRLYSSGQLAAIADDSRVRDMLLQQELLGQDLMKGIDPELMKNELLNAQGQMLYNQQGATGSARADRAREAGMSDVAFDLEQRNLEQKMRGADMMTEAADMARMLEQTQLDAPALALDRYFGLLSSAPQGDQTVQTGPSGGGK